MRACGADDIPYNAAMRVLFVSDLHLDAETPAATAAFTDWLATLTRDAAQGESIVLYMLGDLFETWIGDDDPDPARTEVCRVLHAAFDAGVTLYVMHGNRDFLYGQDFTARTGAEVLPDPTVVTLWGERVLLTHGDLLCTDDTAYQELRSTMRDENFQRKLVGLPIEARQQLAEAARAGSRAHTATTAAYIMDVNDDAVRKAFASTKTTVMVHGHTHRPGQHDYVLSTGELSADELRAGATATRYVLDAWHTQGGVLERNEQGWARRVITFT
jgi:UDP-2,3-diacylglucosamine hydrolase